VFKSIEEFEDTKGAISLFSEAVIILSSGVACENSTTQKFVLCS